MFSRGSLQKRRAGAVPVYLNVYDLTPMNGYAYWLGLGVYHSGVQVHGVEYAYGAHEHPTTGIFEGEPRHCPGFVFRKAILIGRTDLGAAAVRALMDEMASEFTGDSYNLVSKNCNHFCNEACLRLTGKPIPKWVNRLAKIGLLCNCVLPVKMAAARRRAAEEGKGSERRKLTSHSTRYSSIGTGNDDASSSSSTTMISHPVTTIASRSLGSSSTRGWRSSAFISTGLKA